MAMNLRSPLPSLLLCLGLIALACPATGATGLNRGVSGLALDDLLPTATFDPAIPTQAQVTGVVPGERPLRPDEVLRYFAALAAASPRARLVEFGRTYEDRPLVYLAISSAATIADLDGFRAAHGRRLDPRQGGVPSAAELAGTKAVAWLAYGIHGDELSSTDAAAVVAYRLVAGTDPQAEHLRASLLVLIDPCENPDGRTRYLAQTTSFAHRRAQPDQDDLAHRTVWPWGRGNHYLFDMNRDWFTMLLPESARSATIAAWLPQMVVDSHEMGANASYLFPPPRHPFNPLLPPNTRKWEEPVSRDQARALDRRGYPYFSGEWNEEFFPGYGSSWAGYHGAIGILYEMSRTSGTLVRKRNGTVRTFAQAVDHQVTSSLANLASLADNASAVLADQIAARDLAARGGGARAGQVWVFPPDVRYPGRLAAFAGLLTAQGIEVRHLAGDRPREARLTDARTGETAKVTLVPGTLLVDTAQPAGYLARVLLDPHVPMEATFFAEEREFLEKGKGSRLYDTTAWSLPLLRGIPAGWAGKVPGGDWPAWTAAAPPPPSPVRPAAPYYLIDGDPDDAPTVLAALLQRGLTVRVAEKAFDHGGRSFFPGALVVQREGNPADLDAILAEIAAATGVAPLAVDSARPDTGPDLGGSHFMVLTEPRIGVVTGMPVSPAAYGFVWHLLDQGLDLRFSALDVGSFARIDLSRYNVLVFPPISGGTAMYRQILGDDGLAGLRRWIEAGGTAIGLAGGARLLADKDVGLTRTRFRDQVVTEFPSPVWSIPAEAAEAAGRPTATGVRPARTDDGKGQPTAAVVPRRTPYDVAPVLGAGARPFTAGHDQGTDLGGAPQAMDTWLAAVLPPGRAAPEEADRLQADGRLRSMMPQGALLRAELDGEAWLTWGLPAEITVWFGGRDPLIAAPPVTVAAAFAPTERLHLGGLLWPEAAARLARTAYATREAVGRGQVILFAEHPGYRRWTVESERMLANALLLGPGLGTRWSTPW